MSITGYSLITASSANAGAGAAINLLKRANNKEAIEFIDRELHMELKQKQEKSLVKAMEKPSDWLTERHDAWPAIKEDVAEQFTKKLDKFYKAGYTYEEAQAKALRYADALLQMEMDELDIRLPGASTVFQSAYADKQQRDTKYGLAFGAGESEDDIYKRLRAKKKAKKANRIGADDHY